LDWLVRVLPLTLLIILGLAGLRGAVTKPRGHRDAAARALDELAAALQAEPAGADA